jgi:hypothetical protein
MQILSFLNIHMCDIISSILSGLFAYAMLKALFFIINNDTSAVFCMCRREGG